MSEPELTGEIEVHGQLVIHTGGPVEGGLELLVLTGVTDWGPWAQHNVPCAVCHERAAVVDLGGWVFGPCGVCAGQGWILDRRKLPWWRTLAASLVRLFTTG